MLNVKLKDCQRCGNPVVETKAEAERRRLLDYKVLCACCEEEFEEVKVERKLGNLYYMTSTEPCCW